MSTKKKVQRVLVGICAAIVALFLLLILIPSDENNYDVNATDAPAVSAQVPDSDEDNAGSGDIVFAIVLASVLIFSFVYLTVSIVKFCSKKFKRVSVHNKPISTFGSISPVAPQIVQSDTSPNTSAAVTPPTDDISASSDIASCCESSSITEANDVNDELTPVENTVLSKLYAVNNMDDLFIQSVDAVFDAADASTSMLQRRFKLGYSQASHIIDKMEEAGIVGSFMGSKPRELLISKDSWSVIKKSFEQNRPATTPDDAAPYPTQSVTAVEDTQQKPQAPYYDLVQQDDDERFQQQLGMTPVEYVLYRVDHMNGIEFEGWCQRLLIINNYKNTSSTKASNDQGVDILAEKDGVRYAFQCKCYSTDLGNKPVQEVNAGKAIYRCHVGVVITNRYFTQGAKDAAEATGTLLWDRDYLSSLIEEALKIPPYRIMLLRLYY